MAAQIAANSKVAGFAVWLFEVVIENVSRAALADSELPFVNWQILNGCLASLGSCPDRMMELVRLFAGGLKAPYPPVTRDIQEFCNNFIRLTYIFFETFGWQCYFMMVVIIIFVSL